MPGYTNVINQIEKLYEEWEKLGSQLSSMKPAAKVKAMARINAIRREINMLELTN